MCLTASHPLSANVNAAIALRTALVGTTDIKRMFTAYDITKDVRAEVGVQVNVGHSEVKNLVHAKQFDLYNNGYTRVSIPTPSGDALLYMPAGDDEQEYIDAIGTSNVGMPVNSLPSPNTVTLPSPNAPQASLSGGNSISVSSPSLSGALTAAVTAAAASTAAATSVKMQSVDADYRLPIYGDQLSEIDCLPGGTAVVYVHSGKRIEVCNPSTQGATPYATYNVNADGRIRLSGKVLDAHLPSPKKTYKVTTSADSIVIETA